MTTKFKNLRKDLKDLEDNHQLDMDSASGDKITSSNRISSYILLFAFLATLVFYIGSRVDLPTFEDNPIGEVIQNFDRPSQSLLDGMGEWMNEMGYGVLTDEELIALRNEGVTATYTSQIRELGYTEVTLDELVELQDADVSVLFARMMKEMGYELSIQDLIDLRRNNVTAYFTSNMMDLGYTMEELSKENLQRLRGLGVTHEMAERLFESNGERPTIDELIRYRISNQ